MLKRTSPGPHIALVLSGLEAGGSEHIVSQLCNHFASLGWTVTLFAFEDRAVRPYYEHDPAVRILKLGLKSARRGALGGGRTMRARHRVLRRMFEATRPDIVVSFLTRTNIVSVLAARGLGIPVIVSERNNPALQSVGPIWNALRRYAYRRAAGLVTMTEGAMRWFTASMPVRGWVIPNPATLPEKPVQRLSDGRTICAVGRLVPQKGFDLLLDAFAQVAAAVPDWKLVIWGEGAGRAALEAQRQRLGLAGRVEMPGVTTSPGEWLGRADMFVLSSRFEGWGLVVGESMAVGLPVVSFDCEWGPAEMIEHGRSGVLVRNGDVDGLAAAMIALARDAEMRRRLGQEAERRMQRFEPAQVLARWEEVVTGVLAGIQEGATTCPEPL